MSILDCQMFGGLEKFLGSFLLALLYRLTMPQDGVSYKRRLLDHLVLPLVAKLGEQGLPVL